MSRQRLIGLVGGVTWRSTLDYYRAINEEVGRRLGGVHGARLVLVSLDFDEVRTRAAAGDEPALLELYSEAAATLARAGAEALLLCANTAHRRAEELQRRVGIPLLHIADAAGEAARRVGAGRVGLLGTRATMEEGFIRERLGRRFGLEVLTPPQTARARLDSLIFEEMARGVFSRTALDFALELMRDLVAAGAEAVILGCTELPILLRDASLPCPALDTTRLHALSAVDFALKDLA
ncbi:MAG TPA: amino acid racemase [Burkholderiales bacterium]|nr:amino acid racemase [Burkholderiales bacterium]